MAADRPLNERPAAKPFPAVSAPALQSGVSEPVEPKKGGMGCCGWIVFIPVAIAAVVVIGMIIAGIAEAAKSSNSTPRSASSFSAQQNMSGTPQAAAPNEKCLAAAKTATMAEQERYDELQLDNEANFIALWRPAFTECKSAQEWLDAARIYPLLAGVTSVDFVDTTSLEIWCRDEPNLPACLGLGG